MLKPVTKVLVLMMGLSLSACVAPTNQQQERTISRVGNNQVVPQPQAAANNDPVVTPNFGAGGLTWDAAGNTALRYRFAVQERNGEIVICGAYTGFGGGNIRALSREAMRQATVTMNGQTLLCDLRFFNEASNANWSTSLVGVETNCRSTGQAVGAVPLNTVRIEMREGRYRI